MPGQRLRRWPSIDTELVQSAPELISDSLVDRLLMQKVPRNQEYYHIRRGWGVPQGGQMCHFSTIFFTVFLLAVVIFTLSFDRETNRFVKGAFIVHQQIIQPLSIRSRNKRADRMSHDPRLADQWSVGYFMGLDNLTNWTGSNIPAHT